MRQLKKQRGRLSLRSFNRWILFLFVFLLPTQLGKHFFFDFSYLSGVRVDYLAPTIYLTDLFVILLTVINLKIVAAFFQNKKIWLLFLLLATTTILSPSKPLALYGILKTFEFIAVFIFFQKKIVSLKELVVALFAGSLLQLVLVTLQFVNKHSLQGIFYFLGERYLSLSSPNVAKASLSGIEFLRPYGTFSHPNSMGGFYLLVYFFVLTLKKNIHPLFKNALLAAATLLLFMSFSKVVISTFVVLNLYFYLKNHGLQKFCWPCLLARIAIFTLLALVFFQAKTDPQSLAKRIDLIKNSLSIIASRPIFGVGPQNYLVAQNAFSSPFTNFLNQPVHNIFLLFTSEVGIVGAVFIFFLFAANLKVIFKKYPLIILLVVLTGFFDHYWLTLRQNFLLLAVILGSL